MKFLGPALQVNVKCRVELDGWDFSTHNERVNLLTSLIVITKEDFVKFLSWSHPGIDDRNLSSRLTYQPIRYVNNADRFTHVQNENVATMPECSCLNGQLDGLLYGHEVPGDIWVSDRYRSARVDLGVKYFQHRTAAA